MNRRKYKKIARTTITTEDWKLGLIRSLKITDSHVFEEGFKSIFVTGMSNNRIGSEFLGRYLQECEDQRKEINSTISIIKDAISSKNLQEVTKKSQKMIRVVDTEREEWVIPESEFDPKQHKLLEVVT